VADPVVKRKQKIRKGREGMVPLLYRTTRSLINPDQNRGLEKIRKGERGERRGRQAMQGGVVGLKPSPTMKMLRVAAGRKRKSGINGRGGRQGRVGDAERSMS